MQAHKIEPKLVDSAFLPNGDQVCIWDDGVATLVKRDTGDEVIGVRKAKKMIERARSS